VTAQPADAVSDETAWEAMNGAYLTAAAGTLLHLVILHRRVSLEESVLMADEGYRSAFADKPRFIPSPWP